MAKQSFDLPMLNDRLDGNRDAAIVLKAITPDDPSERFDDVDPFGEIIALADTANLTVVGTVSQRRSKPHATSYVGSGKLEEVKALAESLDVELIIADDPLTPGQGRNVEARTGLRLIDRAELIMDIFARNARTHQAKIQVELAQLRYSQTRLKRMWTHLSRMEGGQVGTRGPGATHLESDRRIIRHKINKLKKNLVEIARQVETQHKSRSNAYCIALVGYTNAGKSTLLQKLTGADVLIEDRLFSTLDTSTRKWELESSHDILLSDTVGFIRKLPHALVASFHATLMEAQEADLLLHIVDGSSPHVEDDVETVMETLERIGCADKRRLLVFNKSDRIPDERRIDLQYLLAENDDSFIISASEEMGIYGEGSLSERIHQIIIEEEQEVEYRLPHARSDLVALLRRIGVVLEEKYDEEGVQLKVQLTSRERARFEANLIEAGVEVGLGGKEV